MRYHVLAADYDGTLAHHGIVSQSTINSLQQLRDSGRHLILVTGRRLQPILELFPNPGLFDRIVCENGAVVFDPKSRQETLLAESPPAEFIQQLRARGVEKIEQGRCIVALWRPAEHAALQVISQLALEMQIIFNKDAVMVLPTGINKAAGLRAALHDLGLSLWNTVAVGDAENDEAMLRTCGASAAVANALEPVKQIADINLDGERGLGVEQLIDDILETDLYHLEKQQERVSRRSFKTPHARGIVVGTRLDGRPLTIPEYGESVMVTGGPGGGKSKLAIGILERLSPRGVQCCIVDPEGDYQNADNTITLGNAERAPSVEEVIGVLESPDAHCSVSLFSIEKNDRPAYFDKLYRGLCELRSRTGRPHWIIVDEAHYAIPIKWQPAEQWSPAELQGMIFITAFHDRFSQKILKHIHWFISIAEDPAKSIRECCELLNEPIPRFHPPEDNETHHALAWRRGTDKPIWFSRIAPRSTAQRHLHSHYEGDMDETDQFVFRGRENRMRLYTPNIKQFLSIASGVDDDTWEFHKESGDYSQWIGEVVKDSELADEIARIERNTALSTLVSRESILELIRERFEPKW